MSLSQKLADQMEQHKQQIIHCETIAMMTKYQLVFIKMETLINKLGVLTKIKSNQQKQYAFQKLCVVSISRNHFKIILLEAKRKLKYIETIFARKRKQHLAFAFLKVRFQVGKRNDKIKKSFLQVIASKEAEIKSLQNKEQEMLENLTIQKQKEQELQSKIKQKEIYILQMENEFKKQPATSKVRHLEIENQELQDRVIAAEDSTNLFIREMNELLDSHEISTNLDSDENQSYEQHIEFQSQRQNPLRGKNFYSKLQRAKIN